MSDTSRKRSRKSKLVPRECSIESEDDVDMQLLLSKVSKPMTQFMNIETQVQETTSSLIKENPQYNILKKIAASEKKDTEPTSPLKFVIKVEVEQCDDYQINVEVDEKYFPATTPSEDPNKQSANIATSSKNTYKSNTNCTSEVENPKLLTFSLSEDKILEAADQIMQNSNNYADKMLDICVRNTIGHEMKGSQYIGLHEEKIQEALNEWRLWQHRSFLRESPLFYKCYICEKSWWYLSEFREHIAQHSVLNISLEMYEKHEVNVIAYAETVPEVKQIHTDGLCYRCGKEFETHKLTSRSCLKYYGNLGCFKQFFTCSSLISHVDNCTNCITTEWNVLCVVCKTKFESEALMFQHLLLSHTVRSDVPVSSRYSICKTCLGRYFCSYLHICGRQGPHMSCTHCFKRYPNRISVEIHMEGASECYTCEVCNTVLPWSCMKYQHMMAHTDKYMLVWKCVQCEDYKVYIDPDGALHHRFLSHKMNRALRHLGYFIKIMIPRSCIYPSESTCKVTELLESPVTQSISRPLPEVEHEPAVNQEQLSVTEGQNENVAIKEVPQDFEDYISASHITIKEESNDNTLNEFIIEENPTNIYVPEIDIKQEYVDEESDVYEDDIIKLNIDINDHFMVKQEPESNELLQESHDSQESINYTFESADEAQESGHPVIIKQESILEPEVIINGKEKKVYRCTTCGFKANHREYREHVETDCIKSGVNVKNFVCTKCSAEFSNMKKYLGHFTLHGYKALSCPECLKEFFCYTNLIPHVQAHIKQNFVRVKSITIDGSKSNPEYQCKKCTDKVNLYEFFEHWELHVKRTPQSVVQNVPAEVHRKPGDIDEETIKELLNRIQQQPKQCNLCQRPFKRINECKRHLIEHLLTDAYSHKSTFSELRCQMCGTGFFTPERFKQHMRDHASLPVYKCELCDRTFSDSSNFTKHKKVHNLKVFVCDLCGKKFQAKLSLMKHIEDHKTTEPIQCKICDRTFFFQNSFRRHMRYNHEKDSFVYRCVICSERFLSLKLKWIHMWEVHKERKHKADCPICFKSFRKYTDVRIHARKEHNAEVSVLCVKNTSNTVSDVGNVLQFKDFKIGEPETLVIYE